MTEPARPSGFDANRVTTGQKALFITGVLLFISFFLPWEGFDLFEGFGDLGDQFGADTAVTINGFAAGGFVSWLATLIIIAVLVWEGLLAAGTVTRAGNMAPGMLGAIGGGVAALLTIIVFLMSLGAVKWGAFVGLIVALALAYASYLRWQESQVAGGAMPGGPMAPPAP